MSNYINHFVILKHSSLDCGQKYQFLWDSPDLLIVPSESRFLSWRWGSLGLLFFILLSFSTGKAFFWLVECVSSRVPASLLGEMPSLLIAVIQHAGWTQRRAAGQKETTWFRSAAAKSHGLGDHRITWQLLVLYCICCRSDRRKDTVNRSKHQGLNMYFMCQHGAECHGIRWRTYLGGSLL